MIPRQTHCQQKSIYIHSRSAKRYIPIYDVHDKLYRLVGCTLCTAVHTAPPVSTHNKMAAGEFVLTQPSDFKIVAQLVVH